MASIDTIKQYAMYVIGEVESHWSWNAINYNDPITIGIMQWYGTRAAALLIRVQDEAPDLFGNIESSLRQSLDTHSPNDTYWNSRGLNRAEGNSVALVFSHEDINQIQTEQAMTDFDGYISTLTRWGMVVENPRALIFAMCMYHQSPRQCNNVIASAGGTSTLDRLYTTCLADSVLGQYYTRYTTAYNRLKQWDGESLPPNFGQNVDQVGGGNIEGIAPNPSQLGYIIQSGDCLVLYGNAYENGVVFYKSIGQTWTAGTYTGGEPITGGNTGGGDDTSPSALDQVVELYKSWIGRFNYSQEGGRLSPLTSGYGDCSSTIWAAYHQIMGIDVGTYTGAMESRGSLIAQASNAQTTDLPISLMKAGDLVIFWRRGQSQASTRSWHVEMYIGNNQFCGHGGPSKGPTIKNDAVSYCKDNKWTKWMVRRYA